MSSNDPAQDIGFRVQVWGVCGLGLGFRVYRVQGDGFFEDLRLKACGLL